jgi:putative intracellular protease/amidase
MKRHLVLLFIALAIVSCNHQTDQKKKPEIRSVGNPPKVLFILTSHSEMGNTGEQTGFYLSEAAHPWKVLTSHGIKVEFSTIKGGMPPVDGFDLDDPVNSEFWENPSVQEALRNAKKPSEFEASSYDAIHFVGGHGTMWDFPENRYIARLAGKVYDQGGYVTAVCHGPAGLLNIRLDDGSYLLEGKRVTSFTNGEEETVGLTEVVPFLLEDALKERGAEFVAADNWSDHVQVSERLITGQNPQSATTLGETLVKLMK